MSGSAKTTVFVDNARVTVTEYRFQPGDNTGWHRHGHDYVVVPLTAGTLRMQDERGSGDVQLLAGAAYARPAGIAHNVMNPADREFRFVEIELK